MRYLIVPLHGLATGSMVTAVTYAASGDKVGAALWMGVSIFLVLTAILVKLR